MRVLTRLLLIHWYSYENELIDFGIINFVTGKTASGKSTIIDALQTVILGETKPSLYNKAASKDSTRTLESYLYGELGGEDESYRYIRKGINFTSYVAAEFYDTEREKYFTNMLVADCYSDLGRPDKKWVIFNDRIPEERFIDSETNTSYNLQQLKGYMKHQYGHCGYKFLDTNTSYQQELRAKYGNVRPKYFSLFKKAVPFTPVSDITGFITDSICDIKNTVDVEGMQSDIRQYRGLEDKAKVTEERIKQLTDIQAASENCTKLKQQEIEEQYVFERADLKEAEDKKAELLKCKQEKENQLATNKRNTEKKEKEKEVCTKKLQDLHHEHDTSDIGKKEEKLKAQRTDISQKLNELTAKESNAYANLHQYGKAWEVQLTELQKIHFPYGEQERSIVSQLEELNFTTVKDFSFTSLSVFRDLSLDIGEARANANHEVAELSNKIEEKEKQINDLTQGIKPFKPYVTKLRDLIEQELRARKKEIVHVDVLADCLEIKDQSWRNAIEGYLNNQKFYLLVPEQYYTEALHIYEDAKTDLQLYDAGLVDIGKLKKDYTPHLKQKCLAEEIESNHPDALLYAQYLLQDVIKCETVDELNQNKIGITKSCMLYKNYVCRKLNPKRYADPFIGRRSMNEFLKKLQHENEEMKHLCDIQRNTYRILDTAAKLQSMSSNEALGYQNDTSFHAKIVTYQQNLDEIDREYLALDLTYLDKLKNKINEANKKLLDIGAELRQLDNENGSIQTALSAIEDQIPVCEQEILNKTNYLNEKYSPEWIEGIGEQRFQAASAGQRVLTLKESFDRQIKQTQTLLNKAQSNRNSLRQQYVTKYILSFSIADDSNEEYDRDLSNLQKIELPKYMDDIKDAKELAYKKFRDDYIAKMKSNIEEVKQQIKELNDALKNSQFGTDSYHFEVDAKNDEKQFYDMIMDPMLMNEGGYNLMSESFNEKYKNEIKRLFDILIQNEVSDIPSDKRKSYEENIRKYTDYRTYLTFDLIVTDEKGNKQRLSKTMKKKSGGETQIPFYLSLLASFAQICMVRYNSRNNTMRLIVLDEAFSKMDGERIRQCIPLLRKFGLQAIFSAPPDKIGDIADLVDRNIAVYRDGKKSFTKYFDPKQIDEELLEDDE
jgi:hypothetical protein